jgi:hypothetical protein
LIKVFDDGKNNYFRGNQGIFFHDAIYQNNFFAGAGFSTIFDHHQKCHTNPPCLIGVNGYLIIIGWQNHVIIG